MVFLLCASNNNIVNICQHISTKLCSQHLGYHYGETSTSILEPLRHSKVAISDAGSYEDSLQSSSFFIQILRINCHKFEFKLELLKFEFKKELEKEKKE
jgi:hypothetical protein